MKILDYYIIKKFLGTYFYSIVLIISVAIVFDISEKLDDFIDKQAPIKEIVFDYYLNFIPYFTNLFSYLFTFISVIFVTSKMASDTEIIAILNSGVSFNRFLRPYFISALVIASLNYTLGNFIIPPASKVKLAFEEKYLRNPIRYSDRNLHKQIEPNVFIYLDNYNNMENVGSKFAIEKFENKQLISKLNAELIKWDSIKNNWSIINYRIRNINSEFVEEFKTGSQIDTSINLHPSEFALRDNVVESMNLFQLDKFIEDQQMKGAEDIEVFLIEKYSRLASPFATFILTLIGVSIASRKVKGGIGFHIGLGFLFSFSYILFMQISVTFSVEGSMNPMLAVWIPNIIFTIIALILYRLSPK
ncbi:MAG: hypothetical protein A2046_00250 [Bacteroidetes bacterium GWA2_30_7]|nr:MAG: hypothetical protein A2046_00250 [Bacteroidetes bacterium GWA2_30_7]